MSLLMRFVIRRSFSQGQTLSFTRKTMPPPDRWDAYSPMGSVIPGTKFIAFKVPLKEELLKQVKEEDRFSPAILMKLLSDQGLTLGGIIDLTFTFKYYNREDFLKNSVAHKKVLTPGHEVPNENVFQQFAHAVKAFGAINNEHIIGVHCTHGVNRTGYLICRYMIEEMDFEPETAITLFNEARGHELERENYLQDLRNRIRGQSSYDPNFQVQDVEPRNKGEYYNGTRDKPRWRHNKGNYPEWRRKYHHSTSIPETNISSSDVSCVADTVRPVNSRPAHHRNKWGFQNTPSYYSTDRNFNRDRSAQGSSDHYRVNDERTGNKPVYESLNPDLKYSSHHIDRYIYGRFTPNYEDNSHRADSASHERSDPSWSNNPDTNTPAHEKYTPNWTGHNRKMNGSGYCGARFNPMNSSRAEGRGRNREGGFRSHDKSTRSSHDEK